MPFFTFTSEAFDHQVDDAMKLAQEGPVFITEDGYKTHVLLSIEEYRKISDKGLNIGDMLSNTAAAEIDFELPPREMQAFSSLDAD
jgi:hypothetical protein